MADDVGQLYLGDFDDFVPRRDALAKKLGSDEVKALKKPNRIAWALNQARKREKAAATKLLKAAEGLAKAQERLLAGKADAAALRKAAQAEQAAVEKVLEGALAIAKDDGAPLSAPAVERARQTLHAVALDEDVREQFDAHRLVTDHEAAALGGLAMATGTPPPRPARKQPDRHKRKEAEAAVTRAEVEHDDAQRALDEATVEAERAERRLGAARRALAKLDA